MANGQQRYFIKITRAGTNTNDKNEFINNIFADYSDAYNGNKLVTLNLQAGFDSTNLKLDDNLYFAPNKGAYDTWLIYDSINCYSKNLTSWRSVTGQDTNSDYGDPIFRPTRPGLPITSIEPDGSIAGFYAWSVPYIDDKGTVLFSQTGDEFLNDFNDCVRGSTWCRGAFEEGDLTIEEMPMPKTNFADIKQFNLGQNFPNPFNPTTKISYSVPKDGFVSLIIYDALGREINKLINEHKPMGEYSVSFNASNFPSGVYIYRITAGEFIQTKKMILLK